MRIISSFHDYYDSVQATGQDQTLVYVREPQIKETRCDLPYLSCGNRYIDSNEMFASSYFIGFCGKVHLAVRIQIRVPEIPPGHPVRLREGIPPDELDRPGVGGVSERARPQPALPHDYLVSPPAFAVRPARAL